MFIGMGLGLGLVGASLGASGIPPAEPRPVLVPGDPASFSAHSLLANPLGYCAAMWPIGLHVNYLGFSNIQERWNSNGLDRTAAPTKTLWVTDFADFDTGAWLPNSPEGIRALQYHLWFAQTAQANGATHYVLYPPWGTEPMDASFDPPLLETYEFNARWLAARPEITIPVYWFPTPVIVRAFRDRYNPATPYLNDPAATVRGMVVNSVSADALSFTTNGADARKAYTLPVPPAGSVIEFDITCESDTYLRIDDESGLETPFVTLQFWSAGTYHFSGTIPTLTGQTLIGFLTPSSARSVQITNWKVTRPYQSIYADGLHLKNDTDAAPGQFCQVALGHAFWVMLTGERHDTTGLDAEAVALIDIACSAVEDYACTGFGGAIAVTPWAGADPLPNPVPLPV